MYIDILCSLMVARIWYSRKGTNQLKVEIGVTLPMIRQWITSERIVFSSIKLGDCNFSVGPVVKTLCFQCSRARVGSLVGEERCHIYYSVQPINKKKMNEFNYCKKPKTGILSELIAAFLSVLNILQFIMTSLFLAFFFFLSV